MSIVCIANNINRNVYMYLNTRIFPTTGYARVLLFMFIWRELGGTGTGCLFQFTYCEYEHTKVNVFFFIIFACCNLLKSAYFPLSTYGYISLVLTTMQS